MKITAIKTDKIVLGNRNIFDIIDQFVTDLPEKSVLAITSKIISICEGNIVKIGDEKKDDLIKKEADLYLPPAGGKYNYTMTIKNNILLPSSGIDESNGNGYYILWPKDPQKTANEIRKYLQEKFGLENIGVIITDSKTTPLRWGTNGVCVAHSGFKALNDYLGKSDIFGYKMRATKANILDGLAVSAVLVMGEGKEQTPITVIEDLDFIEFQKHDPTKEELEEICISIEDDLYSPILKNAPWQKGKK